MASTAKTTLAENERTHILNTLNETKWRISGPIGATVILGINPSTLLIE